MSHTSPSGMSIFRQVQLPDNRMTCSRAKRGEWSQRDNNICLQITYYVQLKEKLLGKNSAIYVPITFYCPGITLCMPRCSLNSTEIPVCRRGVEGRLPFNWSAPLQKSFPYSRGGGGRSKLGIYECYRSFVLL